MFYDRFTNLCDKKGVTPVQVRKDLGISQSTMASWKSRGLTPNATTLAKLADYFGVIMADLLDGNEAKIYNAGFVDGAVAEDMHHKETSTTPPDMTGKTVTFQPFTKTDAQLIEFGGFSAFSEFYNLPEEAQKKALEDIRGFAEYVIEKYKKQSSDDK